MKTLLECKNQTEPMEEETSKFFITLMFSEMQGAEFPEEAENSLAFNIMKKRLERADADISPWVIVFLASISDSSAKAVMWAYACLRMYRQRKRKVTLSVLSEFFPVGFPTEEAQKECWDAQKDPDSPMSNYLDNKIVWTPITGEEKC